MISWNTTAACNLSCRHCYRDAGSKGSRELTTGEGFKLLDQIAALGFRLMILSGGEPLMREDIFELVSHAAGLGLRTVLGTNGTLITEDTARHLRAAGLSRVGISIDSCNERDHDAFRQHEGAFREALAGIESCRAAGLPFQIHTTVRDENRREAGGLTDMAVSLGAKAHHIFFLVPVGRAASMEEEQLKVRDHEKLLSAIVDKAKECPIELKPTCAPTFMRIAKEKGLATRFTRGCLAGLSYCVILPEGDVHPCPYLPLSAGNVRERTLSEIWNSSEVMRTLRMEEYKGRCGSCSSKELCGGCRARAYFAAGGDYMASDPWCLKKRDMGPEKKDNLPAEGENNDPGPGAL
ncbi:MAG: radical SAM protein [Candidatus Eremiobacteraeota bacterium]|nr:radical SAM protein [Candidatus Eremiobacteraeota bacterium]